MSVHRLLSVVATIVVLLVTVHPRRAASARDMFGPNSIGQVDPAVAGLCSHPTVMQEGYKCQEHHVTTGDGFIISMSRFPEGRNGGGVAPGPNGGGVAPGPNGGGVAPGKQPVLLQHGIMVDGMSWMLNSAQQSLPYILADNGYDVWISNTRGTRFSRRHVSLHPADSQFWEWSWDDLATHELTATTDYVFNQTGQKLHYVGHSLGTLVPLAAFSEGKQIDKLKSAALLSPIAYLSRMTTALGQVASRAFLGEMTDFLGMAEFNPVGPHVAMLMKTLCLAPGVNCYDMISELTGPNRLKSSTINLLLDNSPQSTSTKNLVHLSQTVRCGELRKFDYGTPKLNMEHYGVATPPVYNLANIPKDFPLFLSYGALDKLSDVDDMQTLLGKLKSHDVDKLTVQFVKEYAHIDLVMALTANTVVYNPLMAFFRAHQ